MSDRIGGAATPEGTAGYQARAGKVSAPGHWRTYLGLVLSSLGLGTQLGLEDDATDEAYQAAILRGFQLGINVIDTATSFRCQRSERAAGRAIQAAIAAGKMLREEIVVVSKGGYLPFDGKKPPSAVPFIEEHYLRPGLVNRSELVGQHCLAPRFLADQIERARTNLGLDIIDVYLLHDPEVHLAGHDLRQFLARMTMAFQFLEQACADRKIRLYGIASTQGLRMPGVLSLDQLVATAREVAGDRHHFRVVSAPYNLVEAEAFGSRTQRTTTAKPASAFQVAAEHGLLVLAGSALNKGKLIRKVPLEFRGKIKLDTDAQCLLQFVRCTPGVHSALVGMKQIAHVDENAAVARAPLLDEEVIQALFGGPVGR